MWSRACVYASHHEGIRGLEGNVHTFLPKKLRLENDIALGGRRAKALNLGRCTDYRILTEGSRGCIPRLQTNTGTVLDVRLRPLPSNSFPNQYYYDPTALQPGLHANDVILQQERRPRLTAYLPSPATVKLLVFGVYFLQYIIDYAGTAWLHAILIRIRKVRRKRRFGVHPRLIQSFKWTDIKCTRI